MRSILLSLDRLIFIKKGYSFLVHVVPVAVAALLLIVLSVPKDNLLIRIPDLLNSAGPIRLPILILAVVSSVVYFVSELALIRKAYLWKKGLWLRTTGTSIFYLSICILLVYIVLDSMNTGPMVWTDYGACYLVAVLSLTGIGWDLPASWIDQLGVKIPDYAGSHHEADMIARSLAEIRGKARSTYGDVEELTKHLKALQEDIEKNILFEPDLFREPIRAANHRLEEFISIIANTFQRNDPTAIENFSQACRCKYSSTYQSFVDRLQELSQDWPGWRCP